MKIDEDTVEWNDWLRATAAKIDRRYRQRQIDSKETCTGYK